MTSKTALITLNLQRDILDADGVIAHRRTDKDILTPTLGLALTVDLVIAGRLWYPKDHQIFDDEVRHCVQDTKGAQLPAKLRKLADYQVCYGMAKNKPVFSAYEGNTLRPVHTLEEILKRSDIKRVYVGGYFLDGMVSQTAYDTNALGYETIIPLACTDHLLNADELKTMVALGKAGVYVCEN